MLDSENLVETGYPSELCFLCEEPVSKNDIRVVIPGSSALETIKRCSIERGDGKQLF